MHIYENVRSFPDVGHRAFGGKGRALVSIVIYTQLYLVATGFLILEGDNLHNLFPNIEYNIGPFVFGGKKSFILLIGVVVLPTTWLNNMNLFSYISATGVIAAFVLLGSALWVGAFHGTGFSEKGVIINLKRIPTAVSLYTFCYGAHPVFPTLYSSMKSPTKFSKVMLVSFLVSTACYLAMAVMGYLMFGSRVESQITLNLPTNQTSSKVAVYTTLVTPCAKYALMVLPVVNALENLLTRRPCRGLSILMRTGVVVSMIIVAVTIPFFGSFMSLVGALDVTASLIFPCIFFLKISGAHRRFGFGLVFIWMILLVGSFILVAGTYTSVRDIIQNLSKA